MDDAVIDTRLRAALLRNRTVLTACFVGLVGAVVLLVLVSDRGQSDLLGLSGLLLLLLGLGFVTLDAWSPARRPPPQVERAPMTATVLRAPTTTFVAMLVAATGLVVVAVSFVVGDGLEAVTDQRRGVAVYVVVALAPLLLVGAVAVVIRPDRVVLSSEAVSVRRAGRTRSVPWERVRAVEPLPDNPGLVLRVAGEGGGTAAMIPTRQLDLTVWELRAVLCHYADHPADRALLGTPASLSHLQTLRAAAAAPGSRPAWFAKPIGGRR
jgi:hypothetical protein